MKLDTIRIFGVLGIAVLASGAVSESQAYIYNVNVVGMAEFGDSPQDDLKISQICKRNIDKAFHSGIFVDYDYTNDEGKSGTERGITFCDEDDVIDAQNIEQSIDDTHVKINGVKLCDDDAKQVKEAIKEALARNA